MEWHMYIQELSKRGHKKLNKLLFRGVWPVNSIFVGYAHTIDTTFKRVCATASFSFFCCLRSFVSSPVYGLDLELCSWLWEGKWRKYETLIASPDGQKIESKKEVKKHNFLRRRGYMAGELISSWFAACCFDSKQINVLRNVRLLYV